ncbi:RNA polymerase sigma factor [Ferruginibacter sp. SUN002]|uniref:RNA polymerase sigma factor n=1 Tax=Ferruginibacter sp. SUN002 TaxID=2937789 RepID=UPI003D36DD56
MDFIKNISTTNISDNELIIAYKQSNDTKYVSTLYQRYMDLVFGICVKYFKETERSKDAVMDIFEELVKKLKIHEVDYFKGWLHTLARNYCLMQLRTPKNLKTSEFNSDSFVQLNDTSHLSNEALEKEENYKKLEDCIRKLPEDQKQSIELFFVQNKCYNEIAEITGYEWSKVRSYIQNGKRNLKNCMEGKLKNG